MTKTCAYSIIHVHVLDSHITLSVCLIVSKIHLQQKKVGIGISAVLISGLVTEISNKKVPQWQPF